MRLSHETFGIHILCFKWFFGTYKLLNSDTYGNIDTLSLENAIITNLKTSNVSTNIHNTNKLILYNTCYLWMYGNRKEEIKDSACEACTALEHTCWEWLVWPVELMMQGFPQYVASINI